MSGQRYKTTGDRAHLSKGQWKKFIAFVAAELQKPRNAVGLAGPEEDDEQWNLWFHQFFCRDLEEKFWTSTNQGRKALEKHRDEYEYAFYPRSLMIYSGVILRLTLRRHRIVQFVKSRCHDTARKIRNAKLAKRDRTKKDNGLYIPAKHPSQPESEVLPVKKSGDLRGGHDSGNGPGDCIATGVSRGHSPPHQSTSGEDVGLGGLFASLDRSDVPPPDKTIGDQQRPDGCVSPVVDGQSLNESHNHYSSTPGSSAAPVLEGPHKVTPQHSHHSSGNHLLKARNLRKNHATTSTAPTQNLYAWAIRVHGPLHRSNPIREIIYRTNIPSLRRFLRAVMDSRKLSSRLSVRTLVVSAAGGAFRVKINSTQEKLDWNYIASRFFEVGTLVDVDVWVA